MKTNLFLVMTTLLATAFLFSQRADAQNQPYIFSGGGVSLPTVSNMDMSISDNSMPINCDLHLTHYDFFSEENGFKGRAIHENPGVGVYSLHEDDHHHTNTLDNHTMGMRWMNSCENKRGQHSESQWNDSLGTNPGFSIGTGVGYTWDKWSIEGEYFYQRHDNDMIGNYTRGYDDVLPSEHMHAEDIELIPNPDALLGIELETRLYGVDEQKIKTMQRHGLFGNVLYNFMGASHNGPSIQVGAGLGTINTEMDYSLTRIYNKNPLTLLQVHDILPEVANMPTYTRDHLTDWQMAGQAIISAEFPITDNLSFVTSARYIRTLQDFHDSSKYDVFRGHESSTRPSAHEPDQIYYTAYIPDEHLNNVTLATYLKIGFGGSKNRQARRPQQ